MTDYSTAIVAPAARWSGRIAIFSVGLLLVSLALHRLTPFPTTAAINLFVVGYAGAALAMLIGLAALVQIWRSGCGGAGSMALGILLPAAAFAGPVGFVVTHNNLPRINDVTTDVTSPPQYVALANRPRGANASAYPGPRFADQQLKAYPDLRTLVVERSAEEAFEVVEEVVRKLHWRVVATEPPSGRPPRPGTLEATDQTMIVGFTDDIVIRVEGTASRSRVDARSSSRYGRSDFGQNAQRLRRFLAEVQARAEATSVGGRRGSARARALLKRQKEADQRKAGARSGRGPAQSDAPRVPAQKERQR